MHGSSPVAVRHLPEVLSAERASEFLSELVSWMDADRPRIVVDCSLLHQMDKPAVELLLCCLEEAMKRNGDLKLAAMPRGAAAIFGSAGMDRLFEVFDTVADAVESYRRLPIIAA
jgi:anti-anti-sigma factor